MKRFTLPLALACAFLLVTSTDGGPPFTGPTTTDVNGCFSITLPEAPQCFNLTLLLDSGNTFVAPASGSHNFCTTSTDNLMVNDFAISAPDDTRGGNVYPGCSSNAGDGGNWNHVAHGKKLHFHGTTIPVVTCGSVDGIPPGSTSPKTPFNHIDFTGTGTLKGIRGNKADYGTVYFFAHCEDRNEPGSAGQRDGASKDRYFLNVYSNPADPVGSSLLFEDVDGNPATVDPITITAGNIQPHISSCALPPPVTAQPSPLNGSTGAASIGTSEEALSAQPASDEVRFAAPSPSPARSNTRRHFSLPQAANVSLAAFDVSGHQVRLFSSGTLSAGEHNFDWPLRNDNSQPLRAGVYFVRLAVGGQAFTRPVVITP